MPNLAAAGLASRQTSISAADRLALASLLAARGSTVLAVLPVMRINDDASESATLLLREFNASSQNALQETLHVEQHIPELQAAIASQYTGFMSHAWLGSDAAADILLGCHDQILRVRRATAEIEVVAAVEPASSLLGLAGSMFVQLKQAYLRFHVSLPTVPSAQLFRSSCGVGFLEQTAELDVGEAQNTELVGLTLAQCRQCCE